MNSRFRIAAAAAAVLGALAVVPAAPASADPSCPTGYHCGFNTYIGTESYAFFNSDADFRNNYFPSGQSVDNNIESASNSTSSNYRSAYYYGYNYSNFAFCVNPGGRIEWSETPDNGIPGDYIGLANEAGSLRLISGASSCFS